MAKKLSVEESELLWKDRQRRLGLPLSFTKYEIYLVDKQRTARGISSRELLGDIFDGDGIE